MPGHKVLKSVSHNFSHSFISFMNYLKDDYFLGHLLKQMRASNINRLAIDILHDKAEPQQLLTEPISNSIGNWNNWFPTLVAGSGSTMDFIKSATMVITFDLTKTRPYSKDSRFTENPFTCEITIVDDRGKSYNQAHAGWWFTES